MVEARGARGCCDTPNQRFVWIYFCGGKLVSIWWRECRFLSRQVSTFHAGLFLADILLDITVYFNDLYLFELSTLKWTELDPGNNAVEINEIQGRPSPRICLGLASTDTHLYVFGGWGGTG